MTLKEAKIPKCDCGKGVAAGSVFCDTCKAIIVRENNKIIVKEIIVFNKKYLSCT